MANEQKILMHSAEMAEHANGAAQYLEALLGGKFVTREQKEAEIHRRELLLNALKPLMGYSCDIIAREKEGSSKGVA